MTVRMNRILKPSEEMAECREDIKSERATRASLRLQADPTYVESQIAYLQDQIDALTAKQDYIREKAKSADSSITASLERTKRYRARHAELKNREKIERFERMYAKLMEQKALVEGKTSG